MKFQVIVEYDPETSSWTAHAAGMPVIVDADSEGEAIKLAKEGIQLYLEETKGRRRSSPSVRPGKAKLVTVEV